MRIEGLAELAKAMRELPELVAKKALRASVAAGANVIKKMAIAKAPKSDKPHWFYKHTARAVRKGKKQERILIPPGNLKKNIIYKNISSSSDYSTATYIVTVRHKGKNVVGAPYAEGIFNEFGTSKMTAHPFIRPAFEQKKEDAVTAIAKKLDELIQKHAKDLARL